MGFIRKDYEVKDIGITIPSAYAKITNINIGEDGVVYSMFDIQQTREDIGVKDSLETISFKTPIDKTQPIYAQVYIAAKEELFKDWEDDIVE